MRTSVLVSLAFLAATPALGQPLPGGAGSLSESYQDWQMRCVSAENGPRCAMAQIQIDPKTRKRVLSVELRSASGKAAGALVTPFGLALASGVSLKVDNKGGETPLAFSTCVPAGCVVPLNLDARLIDGLVSGNALVIVATASDSRQQLSFSVSLKGFAAAWARLGELSK